MTQNRKLSLAVSAAATAIALAAPLGANAQQEQRKTAASVLLEEVTVTARKTAESMQDVPIAISAVNSEQIEALKIRSLHDLSIGMPGVVLDDVGTQFGTANYSARGVGMRSSIPSFDPAVGVFIDGVYMGINNGIMTDTFDLTSIEVLRGPQGTLFGRNTTGGAVLINSRDPSDEFEARFRAAADGNPNGDGGINSYWTGSVTGPLTDTVSAKLVGYYNKDEGWFVNEFNGDDSGELEAKMVRTAVSWAASEKLEMTLRYEYQDVDGDGAQSQSHTNGSGIPGTPENWSRNSHKYSIDETGFDNSRLDFVTGELNWDVGFGDGTITYIPGWRDYKSKTKFDFDSQPVFVFHGFQQIDYTQYSNEIRYVGSFNKLSLTTGVNQFSSDLKYSESRELLDGARTQDGGGKQDSDSLSWFGALDYELTNQLTLNTGVNVTREEKDVDVASLVFNVNAPCNVVKGTCPYDFSDDESWTHVSPRLGLSYIMENETLLYGSWARGYRSGVYNMRNTNADVINFGPGPTDEEQVDSYELGFKTDFGGFGRLNGAVYYTTLKDAQRAVLEADPASGLIQTFRNAGDIDIYGGELEANFALSDSLILTANAGYTHAEWDSLQSDLTGDGVTDGKDENLEISSVPKWTYSLGLNHDLQLGDWNLASRINYAYRDKMYTTDNNLGYLDSWADLTAGLDLSSGNGEWIFSLYGKNLLDETNFGGDTQAPATIGPVPLGGTFAPMQKGRTVGVQLEYNFM
jgi:iron complex outermembrane receptor protein